MNMKKNSIAARIVSSLLTAFIAAGAVPVNVFADQPLMPITAGGSDLSVGDQPAAQIDPDDPSWTDTYEYGTFAFGNFQADLTEGAADGWQTVMLPVYRLGGGAGRAEVTVHYEPAATKLDEDLMTYDYAASALDDIIIEAEDTDPQAYYQRLGVPLTQPSEYLLFLDETGDEELPFALSLPDVTADSYEWQICVIGESEWHTLTLEKDAVLRLSAEDFVSYDFRCVYKKDGLYYGTASFYEEPYVPYDEELPEYPAGGLPDYTPSYLPVTVENPYDPAEFTLTFAENEEIKYIRVTVIDDTIPELQEMGLFSLVSHRGADIYDDNCTLTLMVTDNDGRAPSEIAFEVTDVYADQDDGKAILKVKRTGGLNYMLTVSYSTSNGTAEAGKQYVETSGQLAFLGDIDEQTIEIPLIAEAERPDELDFTVSLDAVLGGGEEELGMIVGGSASVHLTSKGALLKDQLSGGSDVPEMPDGPDAPNEYGADGDELYETPEGLNLATVMTAAEAGSDRAALYETAPLIGEVKTVTGEQNEAPDENYGVYTESDPEPVMPEAGGVRLRSFSYTPDTDPNSANYFAGYTFPGSTTKPGWSKFEVVAVDPENYRYKNDSSHHNYYSSAQNLGSLYTLDSYKKCDNGGYAKVSKSTIGLRLETTCEAHTSLVIPGGCSYFGDIMFVQHWTQFGYYKRSDLYEARYIFPKAKITIGNETASWDGNCTGEKDKKGIRDLTWGTETFGSIRGGIGDYGYKRIKDYSGDITYELDTYPYRSGGAKWGPKKDYDYEVDNPPALFDLEMILSRRVFSNRTLGLKIYTANDEDVINGLSGTPEFSNLTAVSSDSPLYGALHPTVSINPATGGTVDGLIYVGSTLNVTPPAGAGGYSIKLVFLTNSKGDIVSIGGAYSVKMLWQNMTEADIEDTYTINVVMGRSQTVTLNIKNSLPQDSQGNSLTDPGSISDTWSLLGSDPKATIYYTECTGPQNYLSLSNIDKLTLRFGYIGAFSGTFGGGPQYVDPIQYITEFSGLKTAQVTLKPNGISASIFNEDYNIQGVCFNQDADDTITYDGTSYDGNEIIWLKTKDFSVKELEFKFYDSSVKKYLSKMDTTIIQTQVYYDANGNGKIDGWFDRANNLFILDKNPVTKETYDKNLGFFDNKEIDEYSFAPRYNEAGQLCQYFIKVYYTMNPRCLDIPSGHSADETVRVLPAFTTSVTSEESMTNLTREQTAFRYIQAGDTRFEQEGSYSDSSARHIMYTAAAGKLSILDIPLGGDKSPAVKAGPKQYVWTPDYEGSLMFDFDGPVPINIRKNVTLSEVSIAGESPDFSQRKEDGKVIDTYTYHSGGDAKLNGYLGSFYGNSTFAICVNEKEDLKSLADINPETVTIGTLRTLPNSDYLSLINGTDSEDTKGTTNSSGKSDMPEFEVDMGIELPSLEIGQIGLSDYLQIVMDGKSVGFTIGLPLRGYESSKVGSGASEGETKGFHDSNETFGDVVDFISACCGKYASGLISGKDYLKNMFSESHSKAESQSGVKVKDVEVKFSVSLAIMFEYNPIDDGYYFQSAGIAASLELQAKFTYRLTVCPIIYFYLKISAAVEVSSGFSVARKAVEGSPIPIMSRANAVADYKKPISVDETESIRFTINIGEKMRGFHVTLDGAVYMEVKAPDGKVLNSGKLSSYGEQQEIILPSEYSSKGTLTVSMTALRDTKITSLVTVIKAEDLVYWSGVKIAPELALEAGVGVGIDIAKVELYLKLSLEMELVFGAFDIETEKYAPFNMDSFDLGIAIGVNVTLVFFEFSLDAIGYYLHGEQDRNTQQTFWESHWGALNDSYEVGAKSAPMLKRGFDPLAGFDSSADGFSGYGYAADPEEQRVEIKTSQPKAYSDMYLIRSAPDEEEEAPLLRAYAPVDKNVPFQISGYGAGSGAFKLADRLTSGYSYKLIKVGDDNYIVYPRSVGGAVVNSVDATQLVMSKVVVTGSDTGLQNPVDPSSRTPFIPVDSYTSDFENTGDLDFDVYASGSVVTVLFTGYAEQAGADQLTAAQAASRIVVKKAVIDLSADTGFSVTQITDDTGRYFQPQQGDGVSVYASADSGSKALETYLGRYADYLSAKYGVPKEELESPAPMVKYAMRAFTYQNEKASREVYGVANSLTAVDALGNKKTISLRSGETLENIEVSSVNSRTVVAYSTVSTVYTTETGITTGTMTSSTDRARIKKLCLRTFENGEWGNEIIISTVFDFDSYTSPENCGQNKDGVYEGGRCVKEVSDPYFANLQFLDASLSGGAPERIFLYEMNGNTYLINGSGLAGVLGGSAASVTPLFSAAEGTEATIVSDDSGNLAAVYTSPVDGTVNNALYIAWWDTRLGQWGTGNILAMNHMQVYEDAEKYGLSESDLGKAYLGEKTDNAEYEGYLSGTDRAFAGGAKDRFVFSNVQATVDGSGKDASMFALAQGSFMSLKPSEYKVQLGNGGTETVKTFSPDGEASIGFYAVTFGAGEAGIGLGSITFVDKDFSEGAYLRGKVGFTNTGTVGIRASAVNPAIVTLVAAGGGSSEKIAEWQLTENVPAGSGIELSFEHELSRRLTAGTVFTVMVSEDPIYAVEKFSDSVDLFEIEEKAELKFRDFSAELESVDEKYAKIDISFTAVNDGSIDADNVDVSLSYRSSDGSYAALVPASGSRIEKNGYISGSFIALGKIMSGGIVAVDGELYIPKESFITTEDFAGLGFAAELVSPADEYSLSNNIYSKNISHRTFFSVPSHISMALGNTLNLPISFTSTSQYNDITVRDVNTGEKDWESRMGVLYYDSGRGCVTAAPKDTGHGVLRLEDKATNSICAIAATVTELGSGINIYKDNDSFAFYKSDGTKITDLSVPNQDWSFRDKVAGWTGGDSEFESPMEYDLSVADKAGASVTFDTIAESVRVWFTGSITVESTLGVSRTFTKSPAEIGFGNAGGIRHTVKITANAPGTEIDKYTETYPDNADPVPPSDRGDPDIYWSRSFPDTASIENGKSLAIECYAVDDIALAALEIRRNGIIDTAAPEKTGDGLWKISVVFTKNEKVSVTARDAAGNTAVSTVNVDWFNDIVSSGSDSEAPGAPSLSFTDDNGNPISAGKIRYIPTLVNSAPTEDGADVSAYYDKTGDFDMNGSLTKAGENSWKAPANGYYLVRITDGEGRWSQAVAQIDQIDTESPSIGLSVGAEKIRISAEDKDGISSVAVNGYPLAASVGEKELDLEFPISFGGRYNVEVSDMAGNTCSSSIIADIPLSLASDLVITAENGDTIRVTVMSDNVEGGEYDEALSSPAENRYVRSAEISLTRLTPPERRMLRSSGQTWEKLDGRYEALIRESGQYAVSVRCGGETLSSDVIDVTIETVVHDHAEPDETCLDKSAEAVYKQTSYSDARSFGHIWNEPEYTWSDDLRSVTAKAVCGNSEGHIMTETVFPGYEEVTAPGPEDAGLGRYTAVFTRQLFGTVTKDVGTSPTGYTYKAPVFDWSDDGSVVVTFPAVEDPKGNFTADDESVDVTSVTVPALCEKDGFTEYTASVSFEGTLYTDKHTVVIPKKGHEWGEAEYEWSDDNSSVTATVICLRDNSHRITETAGSQYEETVTPKPEETGVGVYTAVFSDKRIPDAKKTVILPAAGYTYGDPVFDWDDEGKVTVRFPAVEDPKGDITADDGSVKVTSSSENSGCDTEGRIVYTASVSFGGKTYTDVHEVTVPAAGHRWSSPVWMWSSDLRSAVMKAVCGVCEETVSVDAVVTSETVPPGMLSPGMIVYTASAQLDGETYATVRKVIVPALASGMVPPYYPIMGETAPAGVSEPSVPEAAPEEASSAEASSPEGGPDIGEAGILPFSDVKGSDSFFEDVRFVYENGIMNGVSDTGFDPGGYLTRAMLVTVLYRLEGEPDVSEGSAFDDVPEDTWYSSGVKWAAEHGIVKGYGEGRFGPGDFITREQLAAILLRYAVYRDLPVASGTAKAADIGEAAEYAAEAVNWAAVTGVLKADSGRLRPAERAVRSEIAAAIHAFVTEVMA